MSLHVYIAHAPFFPGRTESLRRLISSLDYSAEVVESPHRETSDVWFRRILGKMISNGGHSWFLNDDITVIPRGHAIVQALTAVHPEKCFSLHAQGPEAAHVARSGYRLLRFYDFTGPSVVLPPGAPESFLKFWDANAAEMTHELGVNEDNVGAQWSYDRQEPFWATLPALVRHDVNVPSTLGYDHHKHRSSSVDWEEPWFPPGMIDQMVDPDYWRIPEGMVVPHIENPWFQTAHMDLLRRKRRGLELPPVCVFCGVAPGVFQSLSTRASMCRPCAQTLVQSVGGGNGNQVAQRSSGGSGNGRAVLNLGARPTTKGREDASREGPGVRSTSPGLR